MKLAVMQPYFFPYIGYYQAIAAVDKYILYDRLAYIEGGWVHRNRCLIVHGAPTYFAVLTQRKSPFKKINEIELESGSLWRRKMLKFLWHNYRRAPFFDAVYPLIEQIILSDTRYLTEINTRSIIEVARFLGVTTEITTETSRFADLESKLTFPDEHLKDQFPHLKVPTPERMVIRVLEMCRIEGSKTYVNAIGGQTLYIKDEFARYGIDLQFIKCGDIRYQQTTDVFHPNLSIIDVLMNCGRDQTRALLNEYTLI
jgi:hypothetical protein